MPVALTAERAAAIAAAAATLRASSRAAFERDVSGRSASFCHFEDWVLLTPKSFADGVLSGGTFMEPPDTPFLPAPRFPGLLPLISPRVPFALASSVHLATAGTLQLHHRLPSPCAFLIAALRLALRCFFSRAIR
jgi:hypothetical protein